MSPTLELNVCTTETPTIDELFLLDVVAPWTSSVLLVSVLCFALASVNGGSLVTTVCQPRSSLQVSDRSQVQSSI